MLANGAAQLNVSEVLAQVDVMAAEQTVTVHREFMGGNRKRLHETIGLLRWSHRATCAVVAIVASAVTLSIAKSHAVMFANVFIVAIMVSASGHQQAAAWLTCVGSVCIETLGIVIVTTRPADALERDLDASAAVNTAMLVRAAAWFLGGCTYGLQPLRADYKRALGLLALSLVSLRLIITCVRCSESMGPVAIRIVLPRTIVPLFVGYQLSHRLLKAWVGMLSKLIGVYLALARTQGTWITLRDSYSELHALYRTVPDNVRMHYTGTDTIPDPYIATPATQRTTEPQSGVTTCVICLLKPFTHLYAPCGHHCVCQDCATTWEKVGSGLCPMCATPYERVLRVFAG